MSQSTQLCTFYVDGSYLGVEALQVQEIIRHQELTRVPHAPSVVRGLINLRGQIVTAVDLRARLNRAPRAESDPATNIVLLTSIGAVSLLVDEIGDVVEAREEDFELSPDSVEGAGDLILGAYKLENDLLVRLDTVALVEGIDRGVVAPSTEDVA